MSIALPVLSLVSAGVNSKYTIDLSNVGIGAGGVSAHPSLIGRRPHVKVHNDSGCGLFILFRVEQHSDHIPAGAWRVYEIAPGETTIELTVEYVLNNPPVSVFTTTYYFPGETIDQVGTLGNSPIGGATQTSSVQTLSNESTAGTILVIDIGTSGNQQLIQINNDGTFTWQLLVAGMPHQILKGQGSANFLLLGKSGDTVEALGNLLVDGNLQNAQGTIRGPFVETTPYRFLANASINSGTTIVATITGNGTPSIPSAATFCMVSCSWVCTTAGAYIQIYPNGVSPANADSYPLFGQTQGGSGQNAASGTVPIGTGGQIVVAAFGGNVTAFNGSVYAFYV
jgi:hypothetical protein